MTKIKFFTSLLLLLFVLATHAQQNVILQALENPNLLIGGINADYLYSIRRTTDGGYIMAGYTLSSASGDMAGATKGGSDAWVVKLNASGAIDWQKNYGGSSSDSAEAIQQTADGGYIVAGYTRSSASGDVTGTNNGVIDAWILKLTSTGAISWQRNYGGSGSDSANDIRQTTDGGYIVTGQTSSNASGDMTGTNKGMVDAWVLKLTSTGAISWQRNYGGSADERPNSIQQTTDGGYILGATTTSSASGDVTGTNKGGIDLWVVKLTSAGGITWQKNYGGSSSDSAEAIQQTTDGGYIMAGYTLSSASGDITGIGKGDFDAWVIKLTSTGNISWQKNYGGSGVDNFQSFQQTTDGGYIAAGNTSSSASGDVTGTGKGQGDAWIVKLTSTGNISWQKSYGSRSDETISSIQQTTDGGYIVGGYTTTNSGELGAVTHGSEDIWIFKLDTNGNIVQTMYGN